MSCKWPDVANHETLKAGWHLSRADTRYDFEEDVHTSDVFGSFLQQFIRDIIARLREDRYLPSAAKHIRVPKSNLSTRPGCNIPMIDRVILFSCIRLIAKQVDEKLHPHVYSWRVKDNFKSNEKDLFKTSDVFDAPFLTKSKISIYVDPFSPWYRLWPMFERLSIKTLEDTEFKYVLITDIASYFENINIPYLRSVLTNAAPDQQRIIDFICMHLSAWSRSLNHGHGVPRGIPQSNSISSFLGNAFLIPVDNVTQPRNPGRSFGESVRLSFCWLV